MDAPTSQEIFAGNRAIGRIGVAIAAAGNVTRRRRVHEAGALRVRFPNVADHDPLEAVLVNTAGGMAGGDRFDVELAVGANARLIATTAAAEKIYRSLGPATDIAIKLDVAKGGALTWLPQETILFEAARLCRTIDVSIAPEASLFLAEAVIFGRAAMGETLETGALIDRWRVRIDATLAFAETVRLDGAIAEKLKSRAVTAGGIAIATVLKLPGTEADVAAIRAREASFAGEVGASAWNGLAVVRVVARDGVALRRDLATVAAALGIKPPRLWGN